MASKPTVLVVDDHPGTRSLVVLVLSDLPQAERFRIEEARGGAAGLARIERSFRDGEPLFVLCGHEMPAVSGLDLLARVARRSTAPFRFVLMVFEAMPDLERRALELGADDVFVRTFDLPAWQERLGGRFERWLAACARLSADAAAVETKKAPRTTARATR